MAVQPLQILYVGATREMPEDVERDGMGLRSRGESCALRVLPNRLTRGEIQSAWSQMKLQWLDPQSPQQTLFIHD